MRTSGKSKRLPVALTIAGSDSGGGAGIQADLLTFADFGVFGTSAITALTAQNPEGVIHVQHTSPKNLGAQIHQVLQFFDVKAIKTGMLPTEKSVITIEESLLQTARGIPLVVDPVLAATSGKTLAEHKAFDAIKKRLLPRANLNTPNLDETQALIGRRPESAFELKDAARELARKFKTCFLLKGGHLIGNELTDVLAWPSGKTQCFASRRIPGVNTHGSGCTLSAAIAANLALGQSLTKAVSMARNYLHRALLNPLKLSGDAFLRHGP